MIFFVFCVCVFTHEAHMISLENLIQSARCPPPRSQPSIYDFTGFCFFVFFNVRCHTRNPYDILRKLTFFYLFTTNLYDILTRADALPTILYGICAHTFFDVKNSPRFSCIPGRKPYTDLSENLLRQDAKKAFRRVLERGSSQPLYMNLLFTAFFDFLCEL